MKRNLGFPNRHFLKAVTSKHEGVALILALLVLVIGGVLAAVIFDISIAFLNTRRQQRVTYIDHALVVDIAQQVMGFIVETNSRDGTVMHPEGYSGTDVRIDDLSTIRFTDTPHDLLSSDRTFGSGAGLRYCTINVYDTHYLPGQLQSSIRNSPEQMKELPPPIYITLNRISSGGNMENDASATTPELGPGTGESGMPQGPDWSTYGSYLIRIRLFHVDEHGARILRRTVDQAFIQVLP